MWVFSAHRLAATVVTHLRKTMKLLRKTWFKIIISLIGGGMTAELLHISTGDPNRPMEFNPSLVVAVILYFGITFSIYLFDYNKIKSEDN